MSDDQPSKKELRRIKERESSILRAQKMHKARLLAEQEPGDLFAPAASSGLPYLNIGCSGWFYWDWRGIFYPQDMPTKNWFTHYAGTFDTVELNAPFYSWPTINTVKSWNRQAEGHDFIYTVKASELITHIKRFEGTKTMIKDFGLIADILGPRMGCFLFQLPPSYHYTPARLRHIVDQLDPARRNVVEFRHTSWWNKDVYAAFKKAGIIFCACSGPKLPDDLIKTADDIYVRFHGTTRWYRHDYSDDELTLWADKIRGSGARRVWVYFNNDYEGHAIKNARTLTQLLKTGKTALHKAA